MATTYTIFSTTSTATTTATTIPPFYTKYLINDPKMIKWISKLNTHWDYKFTGDFLYYLEQEKRRRDWFNNITDFSIKPRKMRAVRLVMVFDSFYKQATYMRTTRKLIGKDDPYVEGYDAWLLHPPSANPYSEDTWAYWEWESGWVARDYEEEENIEEQERALEEVRLGEDVHINIEGGINN